MPPQPSLDACEQWFVRRGVPHFIEHYDAREDIWTRSLPVLVVLYVLRGLYALDLESSLGYNLLAVLLVATVLVAAWVGTNLVRHHAAFAWPRRVGAWELAVFVVGPELPVLMVGQWADALKAIVAGLAALLVVYFATSYGVLPILRWAAERALSLLDSLGSVLTRALPLLMVTITFLFLTAEVWEVIGTLAGLAYWVVLLLFFLIGAGFVFARLPGDVAAASTLSSWDEVRELCEGTPAADLGTPPVGSPPPADLTRKQFVNVALVGLFARTMQILAVAAAVGVFLVVFGAMAIDPSSTATWTGQSPELLASWTWGSLDFTVTEPLLRVAGFLATFAGLQLTVYLVTDAGYRDEFRTDVASEVREAFAVRAAYRYNLC